MAPPQPAPPPPPTATPPPAPATATATSAQQQQQNPYHNTNPYVHNVALFVTPTALLALFLPPRRADLRLLVLGGVSVWGTNQLVYDYTGTSSLRRVARLFGSILPSQELPAKAKETQARMRAERERRRLLREQQAAASLSADERRVRLLEEQRLKREREEQRQKEEEEKEERGILERVWMGDSGDDWKEKRDRREKEALSDGGGGYWGLITDQISEVWNQGKKKKDEGGQQQQQQQQEKGSSDGESRKP
ncbi:hypothetical protein GGR52DRAFT_555807 [Hypoxylon sp. FL1284]|nr:hypothetical protein GGR52DRAFT_555807 [Hypoxylon sp. FL1284]